MTTKSMTMRSMVTKGMTTTRTVTQDRTTQDMTRQRLTKDMTITGMMRLMRIAASTRMSGLIRRTVSFGWARSPRRWPS